VGTLTGPDVVRKQIAPYLRHRGIRRIDDLILSHADLDHFNGLPDLLEGFTVGRIIQTPSFSKKTSSGVKTVLKVLEDRRIPVEIVMVGDVIRAGTDVILEVLHPPEFGPEGEENVRSLVLRLEHKDHRILLTGDLEGDGLAQVIRRATPQIDVLQAPHHGSRTSSTEAFLRRVAPRYTIFSTGAGNSFGFPHPEVVSRVPGEHFDTKAGAVVAESDGRTLSVRAFR